MKNIQRELIKVQFNNFFFWFYKQAMSHAAFLIDFKNRIVSALFAEELGFVLEVEAQQVEKVMEVLQDHGVPLQYVYDIGTTNTGKRISLKFEDTCLVDTQMTQLRYVPVF